MRFKSLQGDFYAMETAFAERAVTEIREMLTAMGVREGEQYRLAVQEGRMYSNIVAVDFPVVPEEGRLPSLWCVYQTGLQPPYAYNKRDLLIETSALVDVHSRIRKDYNRFVREKK